MIARHSRGRFVEPEPDATSSTTKSVSSLDPSQDPLGQLSYAPATRTTVVTTTTTTTTSFPPLMLKGPRHLDHLDPEMYPLAATPTPLELRDIPFEIGGIAACFREAEDASEMMDEWKQQRASLQTSSGIIQTIVGGAPHTDSTPAGRRARAELPLPTPSMSGSVLANPRKRPPSPVSILEAAELARSQRQRSKRRSLSSQSPPPTTAPHRPAHPAPHRRPSLIGTSLLPPAYALPPRWPSEANAASLRPPFSPLPDPHETPSSLSPPARPGKSVSFADDDEEMLDAAYHRAADHTPGPTADGGMGMSSASLATATPPIADTDLQLVDSLQAQRSLLAANLPISPVMGQDASLPSPSLSPVTAALHYGVVLSSSDGELDDDVDSSLELPPPRTFVPAPTQAPLASREEPTLPPYGREWVKTPRPLASSVPPPRQASLMDLPTMVDTFEAIPAEMQRYLMYQMLRRCNKPTLRFLAGTVNQALKVDFLTMMPPELSLDVLRRLDHRDLCHAAQVSKKWRRLVDGSEGVWKELLDRDGFVLPRGELQRAIVDGWGWQIPYGAEDYERDIRSGTPASSRLNTVAGGSARMAPAPAGAGAGAGA
ncbi:MAG: SCF ubiquitin ligase complex subunit cdc4, partial [Phylliscum demangeonii]